MNKPTKTLRGFQKRTKPETWRTDLRMARASYTEDGAECSCGWVYTKARRVKVLDDAIDRHMAKRHGGLGIRF